jgi:hypothetical protein
MILAKNIDYKRVVGIPCVMTEKLDGVPGIFGQAKLTMSRQGKYIQSIKHIEHIIDKVVPKNMEILGEIHEPGQPFKVSSGKVRSLKHQFPELHLGIWDVYFPKEPDLEYSMRFLYATHILEELEHKSNGLIFKIPGKVLHEDTIDGVEKSIKAYYEELKDTHKNRVIKFAPERPLSEVGEPEGIIVRPMHLPYTRGRSWGLLRYVPKPTLDLRVVDLEEATANKPMVFLNEHYMKDQGLSAVGAIWVDYKGERVKVGPGAMTHKERREYWNNPELILNKIIEIKYKEDPTYKALREPTFVALRLDKDETDS